MREWAKVYERSKLEYDVNVVLDNIVVYEFREHVALSKEDFNKMKAQIIRNNVFLEADVLPELNRMGHEIKEQPWRQWAQDLFDKVYLFSGGK
jgi:hypothetical protein